jgi:transcription elongation factor Elf1
MAKVYTVLCPVCGQEFEVTKGILVSESNLDPIPRERLDETPFDCPFCGHTMRVDDEDFNSHVVSVMMAD